LVIHWYQNKKYYNTLTLRKNFENAISTGEITPHFFFVFRKQKRITRNGQMCYFWAGNRNLEVFWGDTKFWKYWEGHMKTAVFWGDCGNVKYFIESEILL